MKASSQLQRWFEDDDAMERALIAEYDVLFANLVSALFMPFCLIV